MSGHSKWSTIKRKKAATDAKRGQLFTRIAREITIAAREGGGDPDVNFRLRLVMDKAKQANMPKENIERAIKRGTGELKGEVLEEVMYEGYAPNGIALLLDTVTDNRNRAVADIRRILTRQGGKLAETGAVSYLFDQQGFIIAEVGEEDAEELALLAIDAGAVDVNIDDNTLEVYTQTKDFQNVKEALEGTGVSFSTAELIMTPKAMAELDESDTFKVMRIIEMLEELDDVQQVYTNLFLSPELVVKYEEAQA
ncbi:MAG: YebC/PmpR family DNA-binding transcriptional regulator [Anaerolineae bacterium]|nr:YebC/PmpR family DNA-binding transcriptional regulator [Anaerolineae bacterium]NIN96612.1 YebC/PmpR family DNA-binding transcriptional regulator [Anaerolineae bacterium]NIQ79645.1 YebC/PmpR family DNA-binding transcriptional regulator [Anaerolineae bacterium]